ncbi:hypothetical protein BT96DRAFT_993266 [Gymnopus androsaceus JB14]|uniref:Uncharacterized protein n=1 Tax=Gymnopus androsaceus JB14 TaxID=1447944 RepID=A0A6A4HR97_9AGAR|nr:hypothetical protein BT96DRAFT_993266 [Gymnopus androsaceus JB14]
MQTENIEPGTKKHKTLKQAAGGRVPKGKDFWSLVDAWLIEDYMRFDESGFQGPAMPVSTGSPSPGQATPNPSVSQSVNVGAGGLGSTALAFLQCQNERNEMHFRTNMDEVNMNIVRKQVILDQ